MKKLAIVFALLSLLSTFSFSEERESHRAKRDYVPYRGMRMATDQQEFMVRSLSAQRTWNGEKSLLEITVRFSMPIDPRTVNASTVILNGEKCGSNVFFHFGRKGESVRISIMDADEDSYSLRFSGVESYKSDALAEDVFENIQNGTEIIKGRR